MLKILVVGPPKSGKSSLITRFVHNRFFGEHIPTTSFDYSSKSVQLENAEIKLQIWEIVSNDQSGGINKLFCKDAVGILVVVDASDQEGIDEAGFWRTGIDEHACLPNGDPIPMLLVASKSDLGSDSSGVLASAITDSSLETKANIQGFSGAQKVSAKEGMGVQDAFGTLVMKVLENNVTSMLYQE